MIPAHVKESISRWFTKDSEATFFERIELQEEAVKKYADRGYSERYGKILGHILSHMTVVIDEGEHIVGGVKEIIPTDEQRAFAERLSREWWGDVSEEEKQKRILFYYSPGWIRRRNPVFFTQGHLAFDWESIITRGLGWFQDRTQKILDSGVYAGNPEKLDFLKGAVECYAAQRAFIRRYGEEAATRAARTADSAERTRLQEVSGICLHLQTGPARTFREALQLIWFVVLVSQKVAGCGVFCFARMDQYLLPFYRKGLADGSLTGESAYALIVEFFNKNNDIMAPTDHMSQETGATRNNLEVTYDDPNYLIIGGRLDARRSGVNELSFLFVEASREMGLRNPFIVVRWHEGLDREFWKKVCAAMRENATMVIYNDETMIPALLEYGVDREDVYGYGFYGCNDPLIPVKEGGLRQLWFNLVWPLELALNNGRPVNDGTGPVSGNFKLIDRLIGLMTGPYYGLTVEGRDEPRSMEEVKERYREQTMFLLDQFRQKMEADYRMEKTYNAGRIRFEDLYLEGTVENAEDWVTGGVKYHKITVQGSGFATAADALEAVDRAVFRDRRYTFSELQEGIRSNFSGREEMRRYLLSLPKYGNDIDEADSWAQFVAETFCDAVRRINGERTGLYGYMPCISTDRDFTGMGASLSATPDGRKAGAQIGENQSPTSGMDVNGVTALFNSVSKIPFTRITGGPLNVMLHPSTIEGDEGLEKLAALFSVYLKRGGMQLQLNVAGREQLLEAQRNPEKYRNLCVRVTGYAAYFVQMGKTAQDELIHRTVH